MDEELRSYRALAAIASRVNASGDMDETLAHVLQAFCRESRWVGAVIMRIDLDRALVHVVARHDPEGITTGPERTWPLAQSPTRDVLATGGPIVIADAQHSAAYPGYRREALKRGYRTVVLVPMRVVAGEGITMVLAACSREVVSITEREIAFLELVVHLGSIAVQKARSLEDERRFAERLGSALSANAALIDRVLADGSVPDLAAMIEAMMPNPFVIVDLATKTVFASRSPAPETVDAPGWVEAARTDVRPQLIKLARLAETGEAVSSRDVTLRVGQAALRRAATLCGLRVDGTLVGALIVFSAAADLGDLDHLLIDSARFGLSVQMMRAHVRFTAETRNVEDLLTGLLDGTGHPHDLAARASRQGVSLDGPARIAVLGAVDGARELGTQSLRIALNAARRFDGRAVAMARSGLVVLHCPVRSRDEAPWRGMIRRLLDELDAAGAGPAIAVSSRPCADPSAYALAFRDCERILGLGRRFRRSGELTAQDFGPLPVLMSTANSEDVRLFVEGHLGPVAAHDERHRTRYLPTLSAFLDHGGRAQAGADALGLHVTTLRYRLSRLRELFGLRFDTPDERFGLQLALRFRGLLAPRPETAAAPKRRRRRSLASPETEDEGEPPPAQGRPRLGR